MVPYNRLFSQRNQQASLKTRRSTVKLHHLKCSRIHGTKLAHLGTKQCNF